MIHPKTPCCGYQANDDVPYPVYWNPGNKVVQCHNCGHAYEPKQYAASVDIPNLPFKVGDTVSVKNGSDKIIGVINYITLYANGRITYHLSEYTSWEANDLAKVL